MIPEMTDPLGRYWKQPRDIAAAPMDGQHVLVTPTQFRQLHDYSASLPSGVYPGKCWRAMTRDGWALRWYGEHPDPAKRDRLCTTEERLILVLEDAS